MPALDQSRVNRGHEALMVSVRMRDRALPVAWRVRRTKGAIGWRVQNGLLESLRPRLPEGPCVLLTGDRFCGTARLIGWCREAGRDCRLRMKGNITLQHRGGEPLTREIAGLIPEGIVNAELYGTGVFSTIGVLHEEGHREPWIIAMNAAPSEYRVLRPWDAPEHRGNVLRLQNPGLWHHPKPDQKAGSTGAAHAGSGNRYVPGRFNRGKRRTPCRATRRKKGVRKARRSLCSLFRAGLRTIRRSLAGFAKIHKLRDVWIN